MSRFVVTGKHDIVSKDSTILDAKRVIVAGKVIVAAGSVLHGDIATISLGALSFVGEGADLRPSTKGEGESLVRYQLTIGDMAFIGAGCRVAARRIGVGAVIEAGAEVGLRATVGDFATVRAGSKVPDDAKVPPFAVVEGRPARVVGDNHDARPAVCRAEAEARFDAFHREHVRKG